MAIILKVTVKIFLNNSDDNKELTDEQIQEFIDNTNVDFTDVGDMFVSGRLTVIEDYEVIK